MTPEDLGRLTEEERGWYAVSDKRIGTWDAREVDSRMVAALTRLALARRVVEAARALNARMPSGSISSADIPIIEVLEVCKSVAAHDAEVK